jgi:subtilisin family serine protease
MASDCEQIRRLGIEALWDQRGRGAGVRVAVLDAGMHEVAGLPGPRVARVDGSGGEQRRVVREHGTFCGSIIASQRRDAEGIAPEAELLSIQCVSSVDGQPRLGPVKQAFEHALAQQVDIISCSFVLPRIDDPLRALLRDAHLAGCPVVVAAGNEPAARADFPEKLPDALVVSAIDRRDRPIRGKHTRWTDLWALGDGLDVCTRSGGRRRWLGRSSGAAAIVAGVLALAWSPLSRAERIAAAGSVVDRLRRTGREIHVVRQGLGGTVPCLSPRRFLESFD